MSELYGLASTPRSTRTTQLFDESAELTRLHQMTESCELDNLKKEMIRDPLVIGVREMHSIVSERLQLEPNLMLAKAEELIR